MFERENKLVGEFGDGVGLGKLILGPDKGSTKSKSFGSKPPLNFEQQVVPRPYSILQGKNPVPLSLMLNEPDRANDVVEAHQALSSAAESAPGPTSSSWYQSNQEDRSAHDYILQTDLRRIEQDIAKCQIDINVNRGLADENDIFNNSNNPGPGPFRGAKFDLTTGELLFDRTAFGPKDPVGKRMEMGEGMRNGLMYGL